MVLSSLQHSRWTRTTSCFTMRLGCSGLNGVSVPHFGKTAQAAVAKWFESNSIQQVKTPQEDGFWWSFEQFSYKRRRREPKPGEPQDFMWYAGYDFKMGKEAHERMFPTIR